MTATDTPPQLVEPRTAYRDALIALAEADDRLICLDTDTGGLEKTFAQRFPERYLNVGIAEANMLSVAAGLAARGFIPYAHTMATFATTRAAEQLKLDVVANQLPVRVVATHGGLSAAHFGTTHYALEDLAVTRVLGDLTVVVPADGTDIAPAVRALHDLPGPSYLRLGRSATPPVRQAGPPFRLGTADVRREGRDVVLVATGPYPVLMALETAAELAEHGLFCTVLDMHTVAPLDTRALLDAARHCAGVVTVEEHRPRGGLGDAVAEQLGAQCPLPHVRVAIDGVVGTVVRDHRGALEVAGLSNTTIREAVLRVSASANKNTISTAQSEGRSK